jgi:hypothetical protein
MSLRAQIQDRQPPMFQRHAGIGIHPHARVVWTAMHQHGSHAPRNRFAFVHTTIPRGLKESCYAAHDFLW